MRALFSVISRRTRRAAVRISAPPLNTTTPCVIKMPCLQIQDEHFVHTGRAMAALSPRAQQPVDGTGDRRQMGCRHMGIPLRRFAAAVPEQDLDAADIRASLQQVSGEAMAQGVDATARTDARLGAAPGENRLESAPAEAFSGCAFE